MSNTEKTPSRVSSATVKTDEQKVAENEKTPSRPPSSATKNVSRPSSAAVQKSTDEKVTTGSRPPSARPDVDLSKNKSDNSRVSSAQQKPELSSNSRPSSAAANNSTAVDLPATDGETHGYTIAVDENTNSENPAQTNDQSSRPPSAKAPSRVGSAVAEKQSSRPPSAAPADGNKQSSRPGSAAVEKQPSRPASAANNGKIPSRPASGVVKRDPSPSKQEKSEEHDNPTEPIIGPPSSHKKEKNDDEKTNEPSMTTLASLVQNNPVNVEPDETTKTDENNVEKKE